MTMILDIAAGVLLAALVIGAVIGSFLAAGAILQEGQDGTTYGCAAVLAGVGVLGAIAFVVWRLFFR